MPLKSAIGDELLTQYVTKIENDLGATINRSVVQRAVVAAGLNSPCRFRLRPMPLRKSMRKAQRRRVDYAASPILKRRFPRF